MPLNRVPLTGNQIVAMANVSRRETLTLLASPPADKVQDFLEINVLGLPSLMYYVRLPAGAPGGIVWEPLFAVDNITVGGVTVPNWQPFTNGFVLVPGNVTVFTIRAAVSLAAMRFNIPGGLVNTPNVTGIITAGG
jgi:hypothetical protein